MHREDDAGLNGLVIDGKALTYALNAKLANLFLEVRAAARQDGRVSGLCVGFRAPGMGLSLLCLLCGMWVVSFWCSMVVACEAVAN